jgi:hypothetical protein
MRIDRRRIVGLVCSAALLGTARLAFTQTTATGENACAACHRALPEARLSTPAALFSGDDIHRESRFTCLDCHGGDAAAADKLRAHDPARGFKGKPAGQAVIATCARCHSDADTIRRFAPRQRVDQAAEYAASVHGKRLAAGDARVATCASCHGAHGIRRVNDAKAPVFPTNVAATCARCHADPEHMRGYTVAGGAPLPTNQFADYQKSIHYRALTKGNDLSAPTCNDCHGNHGAVPPGVDSVVNVCGSCHAVFAQKFQGTVHQQIFDKGCVECHSNHAVLKPTDEFLGTGPQAICGMCHTGKDDKGAMAADLMRSGIDRLNAGVARSAARLAEIHNAGIETSAEELALAEARTRLTLARRELHGFDPAKVKPIIDDGVRMVASVDAAADRGKAELRYRRAGLALSLVAILIVVVALALKIRQLDQRLR